MSIPKTYTLPSVPDYFTQHIDASINLTNTPSICCPFHKEDTPSFKYQMDQDRWRCFGSCHFGGDVIALHQKHYSLKSRDEAIASIKRMYQIPATANVDGGKITIAPSTIEYSKLLNKALLLAQTPELWLELDYIMSKYPVDNLELEDFVNFYSKR